MNNIDYTEQKIKLDISGIFLKYAIKIHRWSHDVPGYDLVKITDAIASEVYAYMMGCGLETDEEVRFHE